VTNIMELRHEVIFIPITKYYVILVRFLSSSVLMELVTIGFTYRVVNNIK
jgi:hypothetical protein